MPRLREFGSAAKQEAGYQLDKIQRGEQEDDFKPMPSIGMAYVSRFGLFPLTGYREKLRVEFKLI